jgi:hypothetical protein
MSNSPRRCRRWIKSSATSTKRAAAAVALLCASALLASCADVLIVETTPTPTPDPSLSLPPIGFNHRYGSSPLAAKDGLAMERQLFSQQVYWEVAIRTDPVQAGYIKVGDPAVEKAARHAVTHIILVVATELRAVIEGMLAFRTHADQQAYCQALLDHLRHVGYDAFTSAEVLMFFTESDEHAKMSWKASIGYTFVVNDNDLAGTVLRPGPSQTPLPQPLPPSP